MYGPGAGVTVLSSNCSGQEKIHRREHRERRGDKRAFDRLRPNVLSRSHTAVTDIPARPRAWGITLLRVNGAFGYPRGRPAEEPGTLEGDGVGNVVHAVVLVLDAVVVDLDDAQAGRVVLRRVSDGAGRDHEHVAVAGVVVAVPVTGENA